MWYFGFHILINECIAINLISDTTTPFRAFSEDRKYYEKFSLFLKQS